MTRQVAPAEKIQAAVDNLERLKSPAPWKQAVAESHNIEDAWALFELEHTLSAQIAFLSGALAGGDADAIDEALELASAILGEAS